MTGRYGYYEAIDYTPARLPRGQTGAIYFMMSEDNVKLGIAQPWVSFGSDAEASAIEKEEAARRERAARGALRPPR